MLAISQRERVAEMEAMAKRISSQVATSGLVNQDDNFTRAKGVPVHVPVGNRGNEDHIEPFDSSAKHGSEIKEDD